MRFKTEEEFIKEYGEEWHRQGVEWSEKMDCLFGRVIKDHQYDKMKDVLTGYRSSATIDCETGYWTIESWMLTEEEMDRTAHIERIRNKLRELCTKHHYEMEDIAFAALYELQKG